MSLNAEAEIATADQVCLSTKELACLFSMTGATSAMGVDSEQLFPKGTSKQEVYRHGHASLVERGLMRTREKSGKLTIDLDLLRHLTTIVNPNFALSTEVRFGEQALPQRTVHYLSTKRILEQVYLGDPGYGLTPLEDLSQVLESIDHVIQAPRNSPFDAKLTIDANVFERIRHASTSGEMKRALPAITESGSDETIAKAMLLAITQPTRSGSIALYKMAKSEIQDLFMFAYFIGEGGCWLVEKTSPSDSKVHLQTCTADLLLRHVQQAFSDFAD